MRAAALLLVLAGCAAAPSHHVWDSYQAALLERGYLRTERAPADAPYTNEDLAAAFREIMFYDEFVLDGDTYRPGRSPRLLDKHEGPVRYHMGGGGVTGTDRTHIAGLATRLAGYTGLDVAETRDIARANVHLWISDRAERRAMADRIAENQGVAPLVRELRADFGLSVCIAVPFEGEGGAPAGHAIFIPAELDGPLRTACLEEEFGQAFGPAADWKGARPSVFNDDQEFALLTEHDGWLLRILYDPRLKAGMAEAEAVPIVRRILAERRPGQ